MKYLLLLVTLFFSFGCDEGEKASASKECKALETVYSSHKAFFSCLKEANYKAMPVFGNLPTKVNDDLKVQLTIQKDCLNKHIKEEKVQTSYKLFKPKSVLPTKEQLFPPDYKALAEALAETFLIDWSNQCANKLAPLMNPPKGQDIELLLKTVTQEYLQCQEEVNEKFYQENKNKFNCK